MDKVRNEEVTKVLGKFVYFSHSNILVEREKLKKICAAVGLDNISGGRTTDANAFRSATGDIYDRVVDNTNLA